MSVRIVRMLPDFWHYSAQGQVPVEPQLPAVFKKSMKQTLLPVLTGLKERLRQMDMHNRVKVSNCPAFRIVLGQTHLLPAYEPLR